MKENEAVSSPVIYVDADACPVKQEVYRVATRYGLTVIIVANSWMRVPSDERIILKVVDGSFDAADEWIVDHIESDDIVISADILLAASCIERGARVIGPSGKPFTEENIGHAKASRGLMAELRDLGEVTGGPPPFGKKDRSRFLEILDQTVHAARRGRRGT